MGEAAGGRRVKQTQDTDPGDGCLCQPQVNFDPFQTVHLCNLQLTSIE